MGTLRDKDTVTVLAETTPGMSARPGDIVPQDPPPPL